MLIFELFLKTPKTQNQQRRERSFFPKMKERRLSLSCQPIKNEFPKQAGCGVAGKIFGLGIKKKQTQENQRRTQANVEPRHKKSGINETWRDDEELEGIRRKIQRI